jgi:hypothetical protein
MPWRSKVDVISTLSLTSGLCEDNPVSIVQDAAWASGPIWTGEENLAPTGVRTPNRPARSESLIPVHTHALY